ncbi:MAG: hypothetical protein V2I57_01715 [Xanthomonadales bacterium]|nr:hypothetical protein [Xanthomonadales bacterium]
MARALIVLLLLVYPFGVYFGLERLGPAVLGVVLAGLLLLRLLLLRETLEARRGWWMLAVLAAAAFIIGLVLTGDERLLKLYPVALNLALLVAFAATLVRPPTIIERGLRRLGQDVPPEAPPYLWWVTLAWCGFFVVNGAIAAWTALAAPLAWWTLYNGLLSYGLMAVLFGVEFVARQVYRRVHRRRGGTRDGVLQKDAQEKGPTV